VSKKEAVTIVSRLVAIYFLAWLLSDLTYLPSHLFSLLHHENGLGALGGATYWRDSERISLSFLCASDGNALFRCAMVLPRGSSNSRVFLGLLKRRDIGGVDRQLGLVLSAL